jgi:U1 zinc finger
MPFYSTSLLPNLLRNFLCVLVSFQCPSFLWLLSNNNNTNMSNNNHRKRTEPWRNQERHYCEVCNVWMASDRQSIMLHENGKKHKEQVEESLLNKRRQKGEQEQAAKLIQNSLAQMEHAALQKEGGGASAPLRPAHVPSYYGGRRPPPPPPQHQHQHQQRYPQHHHSMPPYVPPPPQPIADTSLPVLLNNNFSMQQQQQPQPTQMIKQEQSLPRPDNTMALSKQEKKAWESRKKLREEEKQRKRDKGENASDDDDDKDNPDDAASPRRKRIKLDPDQGHYTHSGKLVYLEGSTFFEILEEDMPVQLWTGSLLANGTEKQLLERDMYWKDALIVAIRRRRSNTSTTTEPKPTGDSPTVVTVHVAYLATPSDTEETLEKNVPVDRIRIVLGADPSIPETLEEARLLAMGGEEIQVQPPAPAPTTLSDTVSSQPETELDEATGFSSWSTVTIKRTTVRQELKEERERLRQQKKAALVEQEAQKKAAEVRRMEEAKAGNADDSALGAYESLGQGGYKGVNINEESSSQIITIEDTARRLASGLGPVSFKKKPIKSAARKKNNRRTTTVEEDDD